MIVAEGRERVISLDEEQDIERETIRDIDYELRGLRLEVKTGEQPWQRSARNPSTESSREFDASEV